MGLLILLFKQFDLFKQLQKDDVTNSGSYMNDWKNVGAESFAEYNVPEIAGYTSSKTKVEKLTPKFGDQNVIVNIDYIKRAR